MRDRRQILYGVNMLVIKTEKKYRAELKESYDRGYKDGIDNHDLNPKEALETLMIFARVGAGKKEVKPEQLDKLFKLIEHNYVLKEKSE